MGTAGKTFESGNPKLLVIPIRRKKVRQWLL